MVKKLQVLIGPHRTSLEVAHVNDSSKPTLIDTDLFVGRVLVRIKDFAGVTPDGSDPIKEHPYFEGRSRKFDIQIEGRFKKRDGVAPYTADEIEFGSDFDFIRDYPKTAFNAGMRVARWIDPATHYEFEPESKRPFIMSPYAACMTTFSAFPSPDRFSDAVVYLHHTDHHDPDSPVDHDGDLVPVDAATHDPKNHKLARTPKKYWRFLGLCGDDGRIDALIERYKPFFAPRDAPLPVAEEEQQPTLVDADAAKAGPSVAQSNVSVSVAPSSPTSTRAAGRRRSSTVGSRPLPQHQVSFSAGARDVHLDHEAEQDVIAAQQAALQELDTVHEEPDRPSGEKTPPNNHKPSKASRFGLGKLKSVLTSTDSGPNSGATTPTSPSTPTSASASLLAAAPGTGPSNAAGAKHVDASQAPPLKDLEHGDLMFADQLALPDVFSDDHVPTDAGDAALGPWRFADPSTDLIEDNSFVFINKSAKVAERRKYFGSAKNRRAFVYDPDVVYASAFYAPMMDFNTFDLNIGPVHMNVHRWFTEMPVRYSLRSTRKVPGTVEEEYFCTIAFSLVDG